MLNYYGVRFHSIFFLCPISFQTDFWLMGSFQNQGLYLYIANYSDSNIINALIFFGKLYYTPHISLIKRRQSIYFLAIAVALFLSLSCNCLTYHLFFPFHFWTSRCKPGKKKWSVPGKVRETLNWNFLPWRQVSKECWQISSLN